MSVYFGWRNFDGMREDFCDGYGEDKEYPEMPPPASILFASYGGGSYEGHAIVLYEQDGKLFEVEGSHCSCYGLEDQWSPTEIVWKQLAERKRKTEDAHYYFLYDHTEEAREAFWKLVDEHGGQGGNAEDCKSS